MKVFPTNDKREWYRTEYLHSDHWKDFRARKLKDCPLCERCGASDRVEPHHVRYKNIFDVELHDLLSLFRKCHKQEHEFLEKKRERKLEEERRKLARMPRGKRFKSPRYQGAGTKDELRRKPIKIHY